MQEILHSKILGKGTPFLILHGFLGSGDNWISLGRKFAKKYEVHLIDLRNHGRSFHDDEMDFEVMMQDIVVYCKHNNLSNVILLGHSMGGKVAMHLAVEYPEIVQKLIVADIAPKAYKKHHEIILQALNAIDFSIHTTREMIDAELSKYIQNKSIRQFLLKNVYRKSSTKFAFRFNLPVLMSNYGEIIGALPPFSEYKGNTLFLKGALSNYIETKDLSLIKAHFPKANLIEIENAGHWLHAENPSDFYKECTNFLSEYK